MNEAIQKLVDAVEKASPIVWHAAYRQVWVELTELVFALIVLLATARYLYKLRHAVMHRPPSNEGWNRSDDADDAVPVLCMIGVCAFLGISLILSLYIIDYTLNPTYVAIKELKSLL